MQLLNPSFYNFGNISDFKCTNFFISILKQLIFPDYFLKTSNMSVFIYVLMLNAVDQNILEGTRTVYTQCIYVIF